MLYMGDQISKIIETIKVGKLIIVSVVVSVLLVGFVSSYFVTKETLQTFESKIQASIEKQVVNFYGAIDSETQKNLETAVLFAKNNIAQEAYMLNDPSDQSENSESASNARTYLREKLAPTLKNYENLLKKGKLSLHFHLPPARSLVRLWKNKQTKRNGVNVDISDDLSGFRSTVKDIIGGQAESLTGIEIGRGGFALRGVTAVRNESEELVGSVEAFTSFGKFFKTFSFTEEETFSIFMYKDFLAIATKLQDPKKNPVLGKSFVQIASTNPKLSRELLTEEIIASGAKELKIHKANQHRISSFPIKDYSGKLIGQAVYMVDVANDLARINSIKHVLAFSGVALVLILTIVVIGFSHITIAPIVEAAKKLKKSAEDVRLQSDSLTVENKKLASRTGHQSNILINSSTTVEELTSTVRGTANNAEEVNRLVHQTVEMVNDGTRAADENQKAVESIAKSNKKITNIINMVNEIAFQTNILSINAAIEAAKAGSAGQGFGVVALEVRDLAQRSAEAASEIQQLTGQSTRAVESGLEIARQSMEKLARIKESALEVQGVINEVAQASKDQAIAVEDINKVIDEVDKLTKENSSLASEINHASDALATNAKEMNNEIKKILN
jgi:methyl-accepting chemotaxis protein